MALTLTSLSDIIFRMEYLILTSPSVIPPLNLSSDVINIGPCVMVAGCSMRLSTPPSETASCISRTFCFELE